MKLPDNYVNVVQGSAEWVMARCGNVNASRVKDAIAKLKNGGESAARAKYKLELLTELLTGRAFDHYVSAAMDYGTENEPLARTAYEIAKECEVERVGYVLHPKISRTGASPDGLVGEAGLVELKVPNTTTHLEYLLAGVVPEEYKPQMFWQMACTGRKWCDYVSYDPRLPEDFGLFIARLERNDEVIAAMEREVEQFIVELNEMSDKLLQGRALPERAEPRNVQGPERAVIPEMA